MPWSETREAWTGSQKQGAGSDRRRKPGQQGRVHCYATDPGAHKENGRWLCEEPPVAQPVGTQRQVGRLWRDWQDSAPCRPCDAARQGQRMLALGACCHRQSESLSAENLARRIVLTSPRVSQRVLLLA